MGVGDKLFITYKVYARDNNCAAARGRNHQVLSAKNFMESTDLSNAYACTHSLHIIHDASNGGF